MDRFAFKPNKMFPRRSDFDIEALKDAAQLFVGLHDFRTFMNENKRNLRQVRIDDVY